MEEQGLVTTPLHNVVENEKTVFIDDFELKYVLENSVTTKKTIIRSDDSLIKFCCQ